MKNPAILFVILLMGCASGSNNEIEGKWLMYKVMQAAQVVSEEHNPFNERFIIIKADGTFESGGRPYGPNTGKYAFDSEASTLYLDSDTGPDDDSYWKVSINKDTMRWQGYGSEWAEQFQIVHLKAPTLKQ